MPKTTHTVPVIGILGAIGSGKSTVANQFGELGCDVISADKINHEILERPIIIAQLVDIWGQRILDSKGRIDREKLGDIVFCDQKELKKLTKLVHPIISGQVKELLTGFQREKKAPAIILDIPLLLEAKWDKMCDIFVFVEVSAKIRHARLRENRGWTKNKIKKIENLHFKLDKKTKISEYTVRNNSDIPELASQVAKVLSEIQK